MREKLKTASVDTVVSSPMKRCVQTAEIYFPGQEPVIQEKLRESDFGLFENKNYEELKDEPEYQKWLDSGGTIPFPGGESHEAFLKTVQRRISGKHGTTPAGRRRQRGICDTRRHGDGCAVRIFGKGIFFL
jgi:broad specificity phosphatase PhoE